MTRKRLALWCAPLAGMIALAAGLRLPSSGPVPVSCAVPSPLTRIDAPLARSAAAAARGRLSVVAIGSSSTLGTGASSPAMSYPSRLQQALAAALPGIAVSVVNRGIGGQDVAEEVARLPRDVIAAHPDLAIWQVGTNALLRHDDLTADALLIGRGIRLLRDHDIDVVLMDLQYAPRVEQRRRRAEMEAIIADAARRAHVGLFHRYELMRRWAASGQFGGAAMIAPDGLHMTDASYGCLAADLAQGLVASLAALAPPRAVADGQSLLLRRAGFTIW